VTNDPSWYSWGSATVTQIPPGDGSPIINQWNCSTSVSPSQVVCQIDYCCDNGDRPDILIQVPLQNITTSFADVVLPSTIPIPENLTMVDHNGAPLSNQGPPYGQWSQAGSPPRTPTEAFSPTAGVTYTGRLQNAGDTNRRVFITIPLPTPPYLPIVSSDPAVNPSGSWFIANQWYRQTYYAVSAGYVPGGDQTTCQGSTKSSCLTVNNTPAPTDNKQVILVLAGRPLNGTSRPSGLVANYFENANLTAASAANGSPPFIYENRAGAPTTINDRVVVVSP
jgi:hypothetical protein